MPETDSPDQKTADYVVDVFQAYQNYRRNIETRLVKWLKMYRGWDDTYEAYKRLYGELGWRSTIFFPIIYSNIETLAPKIVMAIAGDPDFVGLMPTEENDVKAVGGVKTITFKQWEDMKAFDQIIGHVKNQLIYGFSWGKYGWEYEDFLRETTVPVLNFANIRIGRKKVLRKVVLKNRPAYKALPPERIYWDPNASEDSESLVLIDRYFASRRVLTEQAKEAGWKNVGNINFKATAELQEEMEFTRKNLHGEIHQNALRVEVKNEWHQEAEVLEAYGINRNGERRKLMVVANRKTVLYDDNNQHVNGRPPFIFSKNSHLPGQMIGSSEAEYGKPLNDMINILRNYHIDNVNLSVNGMWKVSTFADVDLNQLVSRPWGIVETNDMEGIEILETPKPGPDALIEARALETDLQTLSGVVDLLKGVPAVGFSETATGIERLVAGANSRFAARIVSTQSNIITELVRQMIRMSMVNLSPTMAVRIAGKDGIEFTKLRLDNIQGDFDIQVKNANEIVSKAVRMQQKLILYNLFRGDPQIDQRELKSILITDFLPMAEGKLLMPSSEELTEDEENLLMSQGGLVIPSPNDDHPSHMRSHATFLQDHSDELTEKAIENFGKHMEAHGQIQLSVFSPLGGQLATQPGSGQNLLGGGPGGGRQPGPGGPNGQGASGSVGDLISSVGGSNVPQRPA